MRGLILFLPNIIDSCVAELNANVQNGICDFRDLSLSSIYILMIEFDFDDQGSKISIVLSCIERKTLLHELINTYFFMAAPLKQIIETTLHRICNGFNWL